MRNDPLPSSRKGSPASTGCAAQRAHKRQDVATAALLYEYDDLGDIGPGFNCETVDVSRSGMGIRSRRMVHAGRRVFVRMKVTSGPDRLLFGAVCYSKYDAKGLYHVGIRFEVRPVDSSVKRWMEQEGLE